MGGPNQKGTGAKGLDQGAPKKGTDQDAPKKPRDLKRSDWDLLQDWIDGLNSENLVRLTEATHRLSPTAQLKLLRSAADKLRADQPQPSASYDTPHKELQGQEKWGDQMEEPKCSSPKKQRRFAKKQGEEICEDEVD